jgi:hypothetical protein
MCLPKGKLSNQLQNIGIIQAIHLQELDSLLQITIDANSLRSWTFFCREHFMLGLQDALTYFYAQQVIPAGY